MFRRPRAPAWPALVPRERRAPARQLRTSAYQPPARSPSELREQREIVARAVRPRGALPANERRAAPRPHLLIASEGPLVIAGPTPTPPPVVVAAEAPPPSSRGALIGIPRPRARRHRLGRALALLSIFAVALVLSAIHSMDGAPSRAFATWSSMLELPAAVAHATLARADHDDAGEDALTEQDAEPAPAPAPEPPIRRLKLEGHSSVPGGIVVVPRSFHTDDGSYDLLVHFHGNTSVVKESVEVANLNVMVAMINLGVGSAPYEEAYAIPGTWEKLLESIHRAVRDRGVDDAHVRRVALSGWSAGYGAISTILQVRRDAQPLDAILMLDGIHCGFEGSGLNPRQMAPFVSAAKKAAAGEMLFSITHSAIDPKAYASTTATADYLLAAVGAHRGEADPAPKYLSLESMKGAVARDREKTMEPTSSTRKGDLIVRAYKGEEPEHHMAHLFQMGATVLPDLVQRWR